MWDGLTILRMGGNSGLINAGGGPSITFDSAATQTAAAATSISWSHTVGAGSHPVLLVAIYASNAATWTCTYNGVSMTQIGSKADSASGEKITLFILVTPPAGTFTVTATIGSGNSDIAGGSISFFGVNQTGGVGNSWRTPSQVNDGGSTSTTISNNVSNALSGDMVVDFAEELSNTMTVGGGQTQGFYIHRPLGNSLDIGCSYEPATGPTTMTWSINIASFWADIGVALIPG